MTKMCSITGKSERRVRDAFHDVKGMPPSTYFQLRSLARARRALTLSSPEEDTVTDVAHRLGFAHLGRFSLRYRRAFGESPVQTLRRQ
jgi:AraC-like DNA-binding protein